VAGALAAVAAYFAFCFAVALVELRGGDAPDELARRAWLGRWRMFTDLRTTHTDLAIEVDGAPVDPALLYPSRWDEGPGYTRDDFLDDPRRVAALARDVCARVPGDRVRLVRVRWAKTPGTREQPREDERRAVLFEGRCGR
jgi:hypothetical protein